MGQADPKKGVNFKPLPAIGLLQQNNLIGHASNFFTIVLKMDCNNYYYNSLLNKIMRSIDTFKDSY